MPASSQPNDRTSRLLRYALPSGMAQVTVQLEMQQAGLNAPLTGRLWDISPTGGCIALQGARQIQVPTETRLAMRDPVRQDLHHFEAQLRWCTALSHATFVGILFTAGPDPADTFLASYMRRSWTDAIPSSRLTNW